MDYTDLDTDEAFNRAGNTYYHKIQEQKKKKHCSYCKESDSNHLVKCTKCQHLFCTALIRETGVSHIIFHLKYCESTSVQLPERSVLGAIQPECSECLSTDMFSLCLMESVRRDTRFLICKDTCLEQSGLDKRLYKKKDCRSLVNKGKLLRALFPSDFVRNSRSQSLSIQDLERIETQMKSNSAQELNKKQLKPSTAKLVYEDPKEYFKIQLGLISAEMKFAISQKPLRETKHLKVEFYRSKRYLHAYFHYPQENAMFRVCKGDAMQLAGSHSNILKGFIISMDSEDNVDCIIPNWTSHPEDGLFAVKCIFICVPFDRMESGLERFIFNKESVSHYLFSRILGFEKANKTIETSYKPARYSVGELIKLNKSQESAVKQALCTSLMLIQGPPGTGKTLTSVAIIYHLTKFKKGKILVCSPSNVSADQLADKLDRIGVKTLRVMAKSREMEESAVDRISLHKKITELPSKKWSELKKLENKLEREILTAKEKKIYEKLKSEAERLILEDSKVVCTTSVTSFDSKLAGLEFSTVLVDEAAQCCEPEGLLPILKKANHAIFVGDHCQLGPVVLSPKARSGGMEVSLFERLIKLNVPSALLKTQYRMHPALSDFPSKTFYNGQLANGVSREGRTRELKLKWPNKENPFVFLHCKGKEDRNSLMKSYLNIEEANLVLKAVELLINSGFGLNRC